MLALGTIAAIAGSLAGLGGGFIVAPVLRIVFHRSPESAAALSLVMVTANVASASLAFLRQGRVDVRLGVTMGLLAIPGSILGAVLVRHAPGAWFDGLYAAMLIAFAVGIARKPAEHAAGGVRKLPWSTTRHLREPLGGSEFVYASSQPIAMMAGLATGFLSSFFGIGGGILVVPLLLRLFLMPAHVVSATSHFVILFSAPFGVATHAAAGDIDWLLAIPLAVGGLAGGQIGAAASRKISGPGLVRLVAVLLVAAALSLIGEHARELLQAAAARS